MNHRAYFITGTDTNVGKTYIAAQLLREFNAAGLKTIGLKPIASGAIKKEQYLENDDALLLQKTASITLPINIINPFVFAEPIAPHLAAASCGISLSSQKIADSIKNTMHSYSADRYLIEGAGGLLVPINERETMVDVMRILNIPVILVVGIRLGCINHALLTAESIIAHQLPFAGWIANCIDRHCLKMDGIIETLKHYLSVPCLKVTSFQ